MKILISHAGGNANTRAAVRSFYQKGILYKYVTSVAVFSHGIFHLISELPGLKMFKRKTYDDYLSSSTVCYPLKEIGRQICIKFNIRSLVEKENCAFSSYQCSLYMDHKAAAYLRSHSEVVDAVYCYEDIAIETFTEGKRLNKKCIYDLPIGYWREMHKLLDSERRNNPDWAITLGGFGDSDHKLAIKDEELRMADKIYVASTFTKNSLASYPRQLANIEVIPYGFPDVNKKRHYRSFDGRKIRVLYVGGLSQRKGISYFFEAINGLEDFIEVTVVGRGNIDACPALKKALESVKYISTMPHNEVLQLMSEHDLFIFPSLFEGFGLVITEAMAQGTPVITTDRTCGPDIITSGKDGWIIEPGTAAPIRQLLEQFITFPERLCEVGKEAMRTAAKRPWSKYEEELSASVNKFLREGK